MDYIYSRIRLKLPKFKKIRKLQKIKLALLAFLIILILTISIYLKYAYPIFVASCKTRANSVAINIVNEEVNKVMGLYTYEDLVNIEKDSEGNIRFISAKIIPINNIVAEITKNIQNSLDSRTTENVYINLGKVSGITLLSFLGPNFTIELERAGSVETKINSEFENVGINQTLHKINLTLSCSMGILTPFGNIEDTIENKILLTESIIVGEVPETYYNFDNLGFEETLNTLN